MMRSKHIVDAVLAAYGLTANSVAAGGGTAGRTWRVEAGGRRYFVRQRGARTAGRERIAFDHGLRKHLAEQGFPTVAPLKSRSGQTWVEWQDNAFEVYPFVAGLPFESGLIERVRTTTAQTLAQLHELARDYGAPCESHVPQYTSYPTPIPPRPRFDAPDAQQEAVDCLIARYATAENRKALERARERVAWVGAEYAAGYDDFVHWVVHGDYNCFNLLFDASGSVVGVFDFDWAWREVRLLDVAQGMFFFGARRQGDLDAGSIWSLTRCPDLDVDTMLEFVSAYHARSALTQAECRALPIVMLARWVSWRLEGAMKVPEERRAEFFLYGFFEPFDWHRREGANLTRALLTA